ncbi:MAG: AAC(3) family N-acetyltransferase, partial [Alphaproteobacteria bacterium]|nr:AAC(3) family N-acetyltransferase [Alphaproteobacteria bacterium]
LAALGVAPGMVLLVHSSLSRIGWVAGGIEAVIFALMDALGPGGTLVMPTFSGQLNDPAGWREPAVPEAWIDIVRDSMPVYDPARTATRRMGAIPETFRTWPGVRRSAHPVMSLAAWGRHAGDIVARHSLAWSLGDASPLGRVYALDGRILLLGVGHDRNSSLHLAETRAVHGRRKARRMLVDGPSGREWVSVPDVADDRGTLFPTIGAAFDALGKTRYGRVGSAESRLMAQRDFVDFAQAWLDAHLQPPAAATAS